MDFKKSFYISSIALFFFFCFLNVVCFATTQTQDTVVTVLPRINPYSEEKTINFYIPLNFSSEDNYSRKTLKNMVKYKQVNDTYISPVFVTNPEYRRSHSETEWLFK